MVVDLDGTVIKTDLLFESANGFITRQPFQSFRLAAWLTKGKSALKARLADTAGIDPSSLPYNEPVVDWLRHQKSQGRTLILATASHRSLAEKVARHLDMFDEVLATEGDTNLKSRRKRDVLIARYGEGGFDYVGNDSADIPVWKAADRAYVVSSSLRFVERMRSLGNLEQVFDDGRPLAVKALIKAMRPYQWVKNLLVFVPLLASHGYGGSIGLLHALVAFLVFGLTASSVYLLNDMVDVADDRHHQRKKRRPFASGNLSLLHGWIAWPLLLITAFAIALLALPGSFVAVLAVYFVLTLAYSLRLKQSAVVDVLTLAALYTLRVIAGAVAISVEPSFWLLSFSMFLFLSLAFIKRFSELRTARDAGRQGWIRGRGYAHEDLEIVSSMGTGAGYLSVLVLALYIQDSHAAAMYQTPQIIWLACPLLLYWVSRIWIFAHRGWVHDDPIVFALKDWKSWVVGTSFLGVFWLAKVVG